MKFEFEPHTSFDTMKEFLIYGAEITGKFGFPILKKSNSFPKNSVDFQESFSRKIKYHRHLNVNFYIDDIKFQNAWNSPDKYIEHLKCFESVCMPDFSIALGPSGMPFALNIYNKYRSHALAYYWQSQGIEVIPSASIGDRESQEWIWDGLPTRSTIAVSTNGRMKSKVSRVEWVDGFKAMCDRLEPYRVVLFGLIPDELNADVQIINLKTRCQQMNDRFKKGEQ